MRQVRSVYIDMFAWLPLIVFSAWPILSLALLLRRRWRTHRRRKLGLCVKCGYNLTGLTSPRCPECGTGFDLEPERAAV